jgi:hypothetical protein
MTHKMGCFDTVMVPCPRCGTRQSFQSKGGDCSLAVFDLEEAPLDVLSDVNRHAPMGCENCGALFDVGPGAKPREIKTPE